MADYFSPTVVQPNISAIDMTPLERLILDQIFDAEIDGNGVYYYSWCGPSDIVTLSVYELRIASDASCGRGESRIGMHVAKLLSRHDAASFDDPPDDLDIDLTVSDGGWEQIFQDIVRRSSAIHEIVVTTAFTCTRMRPDGFGGSVMLITADAIRYRSTTDMLGKFRSEADEDKASRSIRSGAGAS